LTKSSIRLGTRTPIRIRYEIDRPGTPRRNAPKGNDPKIPTASPNQNGFGSRLRLQFPTAPFVPTRMGDLPGSARRMIPRGFPNSNPSTPGSHGPTPTTPWLLLATSPSHRPRLMSVGAEYQRVDVRP
jgi:hypothetical protein